MSGMAADMYRIGEVFVEENARPSLAEYECHAVAGAYKKFFRDLPQPLLTTALYDELSEATSKIPSHHLSSTLLTAAQRAIIRSKDCDLH